ncbi:hypothetical protein NS311_19985, partial [Pantoea ananatis]
AFQPYRILNRKPSHLRVVIAKKIVMQTIYAARPDPHNAATDRGVLTVSSAVQNCLFTFTFIIIFK